MELDLLCGAEDASQGQGGWGREKGGRVQLEQRLD